MMLLGVSVDTVLNGASKKLSIKSQPRPLHELAEQLEKDYGWRTTYEEAPIEYSGDTETIPGRGNSLGARSTPFEASFDEPKDFGSIADKHRSIQELVRQYSGSQAMAGLPGSVGRPFPGTQMMTVLNN